MTSPVTNPVLSIANLRVAFGARTEAVRGMSLMVGRGETHCLVGESGCGKSVSALSLMHLLPRGADPHGRPYPLSGPGSDGAVGA